MGIDYPVAVDSDYAVWQAFANHYWPALYFVDATGRIRHHVFGEGDYDVSERVIRQLLERSRRGRLRPAVGLGGTPHGVEVAADWDDVGTGETYLGADNSSDFASPEPATTGRQRFTVPVAAGAQPLGARRHWTVGREAAGARRGRRPDRVPFHARDLNLVMGPVTRGASGRFRVRLDGRPPGAAAGADVDDDGDGMLGGQRLYQLIRQPLPVADRLFEIEFADPGVLATVVTFG